MPYRNGGVFTLAMQHDLAVLFFEGVEVWRGAVDFDMTFDVSRKYKLYVALVLTSARRFSLAAESSVYFCDHNAGAATICVAST